MTETPQDPVTRTGHTIGLPSRSAGSRELLISVWLPWAVAAGFAVLYWLLEAGLHATYFGPRGFVDDVFRPNAHETWMRVGFVAIVFALAWVWSTALARHRQHLAEARMYQARLGEATHRFAAGDSEERREIADRLHENVGQTLAAARLFLESVDLERCEPSQRDVILSVERILERAVADCRDIATELSPPSLDEYGLEPALDSLADRLIRRTGTSVEFVGSLDIPLSRESLLATFDVVAGVIMNAASNPASSLVRVVSSDVADSLEVAVTWDASFDGDLFLENERMRSLGGSVRVTSTALSSEVVIQAPSFSAA